MSDLDFEVPIPCPHCGRKLKKRMSWLERQKDFACTCGNRFTLDEKTRRDLREMGKARRDLEASLKRLSR